MGSKSSPPAAPDYKGAAQAQGVANKEAAIASAQISNPNVTNPLGSQKVSYQIDPTTGNPVAYIDQTLSPIGQQRFDQEQRIIGQVGDVAESGIGRVQDSMAKPFEFGSAGEARQQAIDAISSRMEPALARDREALRTQLINSGFRPGTEAYDTAMQRSDQQTNDARQQAILNSGGEQDRMVQLAAYLRGQPLNELNALRSGSQIQMPTFQQFQGSQVGAAPVFGAAQAQAQYDMNTYNQKMGQQNALIGAGTTLGGAGLFAMSDRRLKRNIKLVGLHPLGIGIYEYEIFGRRELGVMADEVAKVRPSAVATGPDGFMRVNYAALGV